MLFEESDKAHAFYLFELEEPPLVVSGAVVSSTEILRKRKGQIQTKLLSPQRTKRWRDIPILCLRCAASRGGSQAQALRGSPCQTSRVAAWVLAWLASAPRAQTRFECPAMSRIAVVDAVAPEAA